jgi:hypothetical protein
MAQHNQLLLTGVALLACVLTLAAGSIVPSHDPSIEAGANTNNNNASPIGKYSLMRDDDAAAAASDENNNNNDNATTTSSTYSSKASCSLTKWEGFTSGLLCQGGVNGRCVYRVPIGRALTLGANTFSVAFANGHSATIYDQNGQPEPIPRRQSTTLTADHPTHVHQSDAHLGSFVKATRPLMRLFGLVRRAFKVLHKDSSAAAEEDQQLKMIHNDAATLGRFRRLDSGQQQQQSTAVAVRVGGYFEDDEEAEGGRRHHSMRLLLDQGVIEVEDVTEGWRTAGAVKSDLCRCDHCACILGLTVRGWRC